MIVRISTEDQYELDDEHAQRLNELDNAIVDAVGAGNEETFQTLFDEMLALVRENGRALDEDDDLRDSEVILPPPDLTLEEAGRDFSGEGLIPG